jgi:hypothetical protein
MFSGMDAELVVDVEEVVEDAEEDEEDEEDDDDEEDEALPAPTTEACVTPAVNGTLSALCAYTLRALFFSLEARSWTKRSWSLEVGSPTLSSHNEVVCFISALMSLSSVNIM